MEIVSSKKIAWFALAFTVVAAAAAAVAQNTAQDFVNLHNSPRADVGVGNVTWNATVAAYAQSYANQRAGDCRLVHSGGPYGENLFWGSAGYAWAASDAVGSWEAEKQYCLQPRHQHLLRAVRPVVRPLHAGGVARLHGHRLRPRRLQQQRRRLHHLQLLPARHVIGQSLYI